MAFDPATDLAALKTELTTDPLTLGYQGGGTDHAFDAADAALINATDTGRTVNRATASAESLRSQTTFDAFDGLTASETDWYVWLTSSGEVSITGENLADLAGIGGTSRWAVADRAVMEPRMTALMTRAGSRAEELFGIGSTITPSHVAQAVDLP